MKRTGVYATPAEIALAYDKNRVAEFAKNHNLDDSKEYTIQSGSGEFWEIEPEPKSEPEPEKEPEPEHEPKPKPRKKLKRRK